MAGTLTEFDPAAAGFKVAATPITRKPRRPAAKPGPKPQYADPVWFSFQNGHALETVVSPRAVEDTIRRLKQAARYLERTHKVEVRVQISVEPVMVALVEDGKPVLQDGKPVMVPARPARSTVKFLGHEPWNLGRRVAKTAAENGHAEPEPAPAERPRRTVAARRPVRGQRRRKP